jgi:hypothetical protein
MTLEQAAGVCWERCQNSNEDKAGCVHDGCPVLVLELERRLEIRKAILERRNIIRCNDLVAAVAVACT